MTRDEIIEANPILPFLESRGCAVRAGKTNRCAVKEHRPMHYCVSIDLAKNVWNCHDCEKGGSVIDWLMIEFGISAKEAMVRLGGTEYEPSRATPARSIVQSRPAVNGNGSHNGAKGVVTATYNYTDEEGKLLFCVCRFEPKDFRQKAPDGKGGWIYKLDGVRRVLYNLPEVIKADTVFLCEGEKDADTLNAMGVVATTNCGGAKKWDDSYTTTLRSKNVVILPDNDAAGQEHLEVLKKALARPAKSLRIVQMPEGVKDVTEFVEKSADRNDAQGELAEMFEKAEVLYKGQSVPIQTMAEMEHDYRAYIRRSSDLQYNLSDWIPSMRFSVRPVVPGELVVVLASTGTGKTAILQNIAINTRLHTLFIEKELPNTLSFERFAGLVTENRGAEVERIYREGNAVDWKRSGKLNHIVCCHKRMSVEQLAKLVENTELRTSKRPVLVLVDYIQLVNGSGQRYERTSDAAEELKGLAKDTNTIVITASQVGRKEKGKGDQEPTKEIRLNDGKDSGAIENSAGLVIGAWRDKNDYGKMWIRILKNTKGVPGRTIACRINETLKIVEESATGSLSEEADDSPQKPFRNHQPDA